MVDQLKDKVVVITGASRGLGKAINDLFWNEGATTINLSREAGFDLLPINYEARLGHLKRVDILVNNAAMQGPVGNLLDNDWRHWQNTIRLNFLAPVSLCHWALQRGVGKIINISGGGATGPRPGYSAYASTKTALVRFSETLAHEYPEVDINCVAPGDMGPMGSDHAGKEQVIRNAAELCLYLASPKSYGITGRLISAQWDPWRAFDLDREYLDAHPHVYTLRRVEHEDEGVLK